LGKKKEGKEENESKQITKNKISNSSLNIRAILNGKIIKRQIGRVK
jgi:hypothetical protein